MARLRRLLGFAGSTLIALVIAHNLVFILAYGSGYDEALAHSGHDGAWGTAVAVVLAATIGLLCLGTWRLYRLGVIARIRSVDEGGLQPGLKGLARRLIALWACLTGATTVLFVLQENLERQRIGQALPGFGVLESAAYPHAAFVIAAVTLAVAVVVVLFRWRRDLLVARITAERVRWQAAPMAAQRQPFVWVERRHASIVAHQVSGRAPPQLSAI